MMLPRIDGSARSTDEWREGSQVDTEPFIRSCELHLIALAAMIFVDSHRGRCFAEPKNNRSPAFGTLLARSVLKHLEGISVPFFWSVAGYYRPDTGGEFHPTRDFDDMTGKPIPYLEEELGDFGPLIWDDPITEKPVQGAVETWELFNFTADAHPVHVHLTQFEAIARYDIAFTDGTEDEEEDGVPDDTTGDGVISYGYYNIPKYEVPDFSAHDIWINGIGRPLAPEEKGRRDTVYVASGPRAGNGQEYNIGEMLEIQTYFEKPGALCLALPHPQP